MMLHEVNVENGHMIRRSVWLSGLFMRLCNRDKMSDTFEKDEHEPTVYFHCTNGCFHHLGGAHTDYIYPEEKIGYPHTGDGTEVYSRTIEGLQHDLFAEDWEDHGYVSPDDFEIKTKAYKKAVRRRH